MVLRKLYRHKIQSVKGNIKKSKSYWWVCLGLESQCLMKRIQKDGILDIKEKSKDIDGINII